MRRKKGRFLIAAGIMLVAASLFLAGSYLLEDRRAAAAAGKELQQVKTTLEQGTSDGYDADDASASGQTDAGAIPDYLFDSDLEMPIEIIDGKGYVGILKIPAIDRELPIIAEYVHADLKTAPCRYFGSVYKNNMVICGHSYISHFRPIRQLNIGDSVIFEDMDGNEFRYTVGNTEILKPTDVELATNGEWDLTLFTCTADSGSRFTVRCMRENAEVRVMDAW